MKLWVMSDLHLEHHDLDAPLVVPAGADVLVLAGDVTNRSPARGVEWLAANVPLDSVYVAGNHEFYRGAVVPGLTEGREASHVRPRVRFLENDLAVVGGVRFVGCTLWTDFSVMGNTPLSVHAARVGMNDYRASKYSKQPYQRFTPELSRDLHYASRAFLRDALRIPFDGPTVVVTHHGPHPRSIDPLYDNDLLSAAYVSDLSDMLEEDGPDLWVHGHTHTSFDYVVCRTRVVCNPRGYGRENRGWNPGLVVEV